MIIAANHPTYLDPAFLLLGAFLAVLRAIPLWELAGVAAGLAAMIWLQLFRFSSYRRLRGLALAVAYAGWILRARGLGL